MIGCILPLKRSLQSLLQITIGREGKTLARLALGVEGNKLSRNIFDRLLGGVFNLLPRSTTEFMHFWCILVATLVAGNAVQRVDIHKEDIAITIDQLYCLVHLATLLNLDQTAKATNAVVDMGDIVAHLQRVQLGNGHLLVTLNLTIYLVATITLEETMLGIERNFEVVVGEALVQSQACQLKLRTITPRSIEQTLQTLRLCPILRHQEGTIAHLVACNEFVGKHLEVLVEAVLW